MAEPRACLFPLFASFLLLYQPLLFFSAVLALRIGKTKSWLTSKLTPQGHWQRRNKRYFPARSRVRWLNVFKLLNQQSPSTPSRRPPHPPKLTGSSSISSLLDDQAGPCPFSGATDLAVVISLKILVLARKVGEEAGMTGTFPYPRSATFDSNTDIRPATGMPPLLLLLFWYLGKFVENAFQELP